MRFPAISYLAESLLGAAVVLLGVITAWPDPPPRPKPVAAATPAPVLPPAPAAPQTPPQDFARDALESTQKSFTKTWKEKVEGEKHQLKYDPVRAADVRATHLMAARAGTVGAFERTPGKDAPWADLARAALEARSRVIVSDLMTGEYPPGLLDGSKAAVARATAAGCDDPLIAYWRHRDREQAEGHNPAAFRDVADRVYKSSYPPVRRLHPVYNWLAAAQALPKDHPLRSDVADWEERFWELVAAAARERELTTDEELARIAVHWQAHRKGQGRTREQALSELDRHLRRGGARDYLRHTIRGAGLIQVAWDARGNGAASTVTEAGWQVFHARLQDARETLVAAAEADPDGFSAPTEMLTVCMGMGLDREEMEYTFRQAMAANPDNRWACWTKLEFLQPKWYGSRDGNDYLTFAWAIALHPGDGRLARALLSNMLGNAPVYGPRYEASPQGVAAYYMNPAVWCCVRVACERLLEDYPNDRYTQSLLARVALIARRPELAREYFARMGTDFSPLVFANRAEYDDFRRQAGVQVQTP